MGLDIDRDLAGFLNKPFEFEQLLEIIESLLFLHGDVGE